MEGETTLSEAVLKSLKWSLPMPSVQELVKDQQLDEVPRQYVWDGGVTIGGVKACEIRRDEGARSEISEVHGEGSGL